MKANSIPVTENIICWERIPPVRIVLACDYETYLARCDDDVLRDLPQNMKAIRRGDSVRLDDLQSIIRSVRVDVES